LNIAGNKRVTLNNASDIELP